MRFAGEKNVSPGGLAPAVLSRCRRHALQTDLVETLLAMQWYRWPRSQLVSTVNNTVPICCVLMLTVCVQLAVTTGMVHILCAGVMVCDASDGKRMSTSQGSSTEGYGRD